MKIAWFTHRYHPCVGGAENYGRAIVRRHRLFGYGGRNRQRVSMQRLPQGVRSSDGNRAQQLTAA